MATRKVKRYDDGGVVGNSNYPFGQGQAVSSTPATTGSTGLGNNSPLVSVTNAGGSTDTTAVSDPTKPFGMKKGGKVSSNRRGDGIAQRGKTRGRMV